MDTRKLVIMTYLMKIAYAHRKSTKSYKNARDEEAPSGRCSTAAQVAAPGTQIAVAAPASTTMNVTCPAGCKEGDTVQIQSPAGQLLQVVVPPGVMAGQQFQVQV